MGSGEGPTYEKMKGLQHGKANNENQEASQHGTKRAAIYVRVSSEKQAEKVSPEAQETDARDSV